MKKKNNKKRKSSKSYEKPINSYLKKYFNGGQMFDAAAGAGSQVVMGMATDAVSNMIATAMGKSSQPKIFDFSENQNPIMAKGGIVEGDPPYKKVGNYQTSFHPKDMAYFERMQKRFPEAYEASKSQYLLPGMHEVGTESVYKNDSYNPVMKTDNIVNEDKYIIKSSGGNYIPRTANQQGMYNFDIKDGQIMMGRLGRFNKAEYRRFLGKEQKKYAKGTGMEGVQNDPPPRKNLGKYTARVSPQDQKFYDRIQKRATPEAWQAIQGKFMTPGEYDLGQEDVEDDAYFKSQTFASPEGYVDEKYKTPKYFATSGDYEYPHTVIDDVKKLSNYNVTEDGFLDVAPLSRKGKGSDIRKIRKLMRKYAKGGVVQAPNVEVEGEEAYELPNGEIGVIEGDKHSQDTDGDGQYGVPLNVPEGTKFYSAQIKKANKTMAKRKIARENKIAKLEAAFKERPFDVILKTTLERLKEKTAIEEQGDMAIQESANMLEQGEQVAQYMKNGGTFKYKYANGGNVFGQLFGLVTSAAEDLKGDDTPVEPPKSSYKEAFKMPKGKIDPLYDNWKDKQTALGGDMDNSNAFNTNLNLGMGDVNAGFQYNIPKSNSYIKGNLNQQLTPLFTEGRVPTPTGSLEGYYGGNNFDITGKLNTDFQNSPTGSIGVNSNPSDKLSTYGNLNLGEDFGMNAGLNWNPSDKFSTGLDLNVNKEGLGIEGTGEYKVNPNLTLGATGRYNTGKGFTGDANLKYTFDRNKEENPKLFANGGMVPKFNNGGGLGISPYQMQQIMLGARQNKAQDYLPTNWNVDQMLNERFGGDVTKLQQHIVDTQKTNPGVFGGYSMGKFGKNRDGVDGDFGATSRGFFTGKVNKDGIMIEDPDDVSDRTAAFAKSLGYSTMEEDNPDGAQPGLYTEANMNRLIHPTEMTMDSGQRFEAGKPFTGSPFTDTYSKGSEFQKTVNSEFPNGMPMIKNPLGIQQGLNIAGSSSYPETLEHERIMNLQGEDFDDASFDLKYEKLKNLGKDDPLDFNRLVDVNDRLVRKGGGFDPTGQESGSNPIPFKDLSKEQQRAILIKEGKITEKSTPRQVAAATADATEKDGASDTSTPSLGSALGAMTRGDRMGNLGTLAGGFGPLLNTIINRATDTPNINSYLNFGKDQINYLEAQKGMLGINRDKALADMGLASDTARKRARNSARGVNQQIALDQLAGAQKQKSIADIQANYWNQLAGINTQVGAAKTQRDRMVMAGEQARDLADRQDKDNFSTQLGSDITNLGTMYQKLGKDMNTRQTQKEELEIINMMSKHGVQAKRNKKGEWEFHDDKGVSMSQAKTQKLIKEKKDKAEKEKKALDKKNKEEKKKQERRNEFIKKGNLVEQDVDYNTPAKKWNYLDNLTDNFFGTSKKKSEVGGVSEMDKYLKDKKPVNPVLKTDVGDGNDYIRGRLNFENKGGSFSGGGVSNYGFTGGGGSAKGTAMKKYFDASKGANKGEKAVNAVNNYIIGTDPKATLKGGNTSILSDLNYTKEQFNQLPEHVKEELVDWKLNTGRGSTDLLLNALDPKTWSGVEAAEKSSPVWSYVENEFEVSGKGDYSQLSKEDLRKARMRLYKGRIKYLKDKYGEKDSRYKTAKKGFENSQQYR